MLPYPDIDPVIFSLGGLSVRWYSLSYVVGIVLGCLYADRLNKIPPTYPTIKIFDDFMTWAILGIVLGGRLGYVLFYNAGYYLEHPAHILRIWEGGMSFHGGFLGIVMACILFCRKHKIPLWGLLDLVACAGPIGLFFGRLANFINGELYGRTTDAPWGMVFPLGGTLPRHPSQLYEAALEGLLLFILLFIAARYSRAKHFPGMLSGLFVCGYGLARTFVENYREPDGHIGFLFGHITTGQLLSLPMVIAGLALIIYAWKKSRA